MITFDLSDFCDHFNSDEEFVETIDLPKEVLEAIDQNTLCTVSVQSHVKRNRKHTDFQKCTDKSLNVLDLFARKRV